MYLLAHPPRDRSLIHHRYNKEGTAQRTSICVIKHADLLCAQCTPLYRELLAHPVDLRPSKLCYGSRLQSDLAQTLNLIVAKIRIVKEHPIRFNGLACVRQFQRPIGRDFKEATNSPARIASVVEIFFNQTGVCGFINVTPLRSAVD